MEDQLGQFEAYRQKKIARLQEQAAPLKQKMEKRNRVHTMDFILMVGTGLFFDTLQALLSLIPFVGWILSSLISIFAWLTFYVWSSAKGWGMSDTVKNKVLVSGAWSKGVMKFAIKYLIPFIEFIPGLNIIPTWAVRQFMQLSFLKAEDVLYNASSGKVDIEKLAHIYKEVGHLSIEAANVARMAREKRNKSGYNT